MQFSKSAPAASRMDKGTMNLAAASDNSRVGNVKNDARRTQIMPLQTMPLFERI